MVGFSDIQDTISLFKNFYHSNPQLINSLLQAWLLARPIKTSFYEIKDLFVGIKDLKKKVFDALNTTLYSGGIYSIYSEKTKYGMGKSQFAYFLRMEYEKKSKSKCTYYHSLSPSEQGFEKLYRELRRYLAICSESQEFYFFIDEVDLIIEPNLQEKELAKRIEKFGNILIECADEAFSSEKPFYVFLVLSKRIQDDFEKFVSHRIKRRITPFIAVDISFTKDDIETFATRFFSLLWVSNYKNIKSKFKNQYEYRFKELIASMITELTNNLSDLGLDLKSSVIGDYVEKFRNIYDIIFDGVVDSKVEEINLGNETIVGNKIENVLKEYLLSRNKPFIYKHDEHQINIIYIQNKKKIGKHETDGYYNFLIGDTQIGMMPVEITIQQNLKGHKRKQLKTFLENYYTLLIWMFTDFSMITQELEKFENKIGNTVQNDMYPILIPKEFIKYTLILDDRAFSLLEELKNDLMKNIQTYVTKYAKVLFNRWMMEKPRVPLEDEGEGEKGVKVIIENAHERIQRLFENFFEFFNEKERRSHGSLKKRLIQEIGYLNKALKLEDEYLDVESIYRELIEKLDRENLCYYKGISDSSFLMKEDHFSVEKAVGDCISIISSRIR
jgi:hypothetical protein